MCVCSSSITTSRTPAKLWTENKSQQLFCSKWGQKLSFLLRVYAVLAIGFISDRIGHRGPLLVFFLLVSVVCMIGLALLASDPDRPLAPVLILVAGSSVLSGPYSLLTACTMDCCGTLDDPGLLPLFQGLQDGSGYLFAATSGVLVGKKRDGQMQCSRLQVLGSWQWERLGLRCGWGVLEGREEEGRGGGVSVSCSGGLRRYPAAI